MRESSKFYDSMWEPIVKKIINIEIKCFIKEEQWKVGKVLLQYKEKTGISLWFDIVVYFIGVILVI